MQIVFAPNALRELHEFSRSDQIFLRKKLLELQEIPDISTYPKIKKLKILPYYRYRAGNFRVIFDGNQSKIIIHKILRRSEATYKNFE